AALQLAVVPADRFAGIDEDGDALAALGLDTGPGRMGHVALVSAVELGPDGEDRVVVVVDLGLTGDRHAPEFPVGLPGLDEADDPWIAPQVGRFLRRGVRPHGDPPVD